MEFHNKLALKKFERTDRKLVFDIETGELKLVREKDFIPSKGIIIDQMFYDQGSF
jgi:hypothetical protein